MSPPDLGGQPDLPGVTVFRSPAGPSGHDVVGVQYSVLVLRVPGRWVGPDPTDPGMMIRVGGTKCPGSLPTSLKALRLDGSGRPPVVKRLAGVTCFAFSGMPGGTRRFR